MLGCQNEHFSDSREVRGNHTLETCNTKLPLVGGQTFWGWKIDSGAIITQMCKAINLLLLHRLVTIGNMHEILDGFAAMGFPNCSRAIHSTHIPILAPAHVTTEYINRKGYFSMVMQGQVDQQDASLILGEGA